MTNLDSIVKNRAITWPTKVHLVKAMVFPVVMYGCESWTVKKAELQRIDAFELWAPKSLQMATAATKLKGACSLEEKLWKPRQHIKKQTLYQQKSV